MITIYHNPRCSKSRLALDQIKSKNIEFTVNEYMSNPFSERSLLALLQKLKMKPVQIIRTNEADFKEHFAGKNFSDEEWIKILIENPKLIQRPIVESDTRACIAREIDILTQFLGK